MAWSGEGDFEAWRTECREKIFDLMGLPPKAPTSTSYTTLATEQREGYKAHKIEFEISEGNLIRAYLLVPDTAGHTLRPWHSTTTEPSSPLVRRRSSAP